MKSAPQFSAFKRTKKAWSKPRIITFPLEAGERARALSDNQKAAIGLLKRRCSVVGEDDR